MREALEAIDLPLSRRQFVRTGLAGLAAGSVWHTFPTVRPGGTGRDARGHRARRPPVRSVLRPDARVDRPGAGLQRPLRLPGQEPVRPQPSARGVLEGDRQDPDGQAAEGRQVPQRPRLHVPGRHRQRRTAPRTSRSATTSSTTSTPRSTAPRPSTANTVKITYKQAYPLKLDDLTLLYIIPKEAMADVATKPVGTGPFKFVSYAPGRQARAPALRAVLGEGQARSSTG